MAKEAVLFEFESTRYPGLVIWDAEKGAPLAQFVPDKGADPVGDPASGLFVYPGRFETADEAVARKVAKAEGVKGANKAARDLIASLKG